MSYKNRQENRAYNQAARESCRILGICIVCQKNDALEGRPVCASCAARSLEYSKKHYQRNKERKLALQKERREKRKQAGLCVKCGRQPNETGYTFCPECRAAESSRKRIAYRYAALNSGRPVMPRKMGF